jgi:hypothetical protein
MTCPHVKSLRMWRRIMPLLQNLWTVPQEALWIKDRARLTPEFSGQTRTIFSMGQRLAKKSFKSAPHSASRMPLRTSTR